MVLFAMLSPSVASLSNDVETIRNDILTITHPEHRFMSLQGFASERKLSADEMSERLLAAADGLRGGTNANEEALCRYAIWGLGHFGSDTALARLEEYVLSVRVDANNPFSTTPLQLAALTAYERITHGEKHQGIGQRANIFFSIKCQERNAQSNTRNNVTANVTAPPSHPRHRVKLMMGAWKI